MYFSAYLTAMATATLVSSSALPQHHTSPSRDGGKAGASYRFLSYNIRFDSKPNNITVAETIDSLPSSIPSQPSSFYAGADTEPAWSDRRVRLANDILFNRVSFFGGQEVTIRQLDDLQELLGDEYAHIGIGRDGGDEGEFSPIFYKTSAATLEEWDTFWLSETPFDISYFGNLTNRRIATVAKFTLSGAGALTYINTHLDHESEDQRKYGLSLVLHRAKYEAIKSSGGPVILTGDFNSPSTGEESGGYQIITGAAEPMPLNQTFLDRFSWTAEEEAAAGLDDVFNMVDLLGATPARYRSGHWSTFTGWSAAGDTEDFSRIDYIMGGSNGGWEAEAFRVGETLYDDGVWTR